jgi:hypothetical protein
VKLVDVVSVELYRGIIVLSDGQVKGRGMTWPEYLMRRRHHVALLMRWLKRLLARLKCCLTSAW